MQISKLALVICCWCIVTAEPLFCAFELQGVNWTAATANIQVIGPADLNHFSSNSALPLVPGFQSLGLSVSSPYHGLGLRAVQLEGIIWGQTRPWVLSLYQFGDEIYRETRMRAGSQYRWSDQLILGAQLELFHIGVTGEYRATSLVLSPGLHIRFNPVLSMATTLRGVIQCGDKNMTEQHFQMGVMVDQEQVKLILSVEKEGATGLTNAVALVYHMVPALEIGCGFTPGADRFTAGWKIHVSGISLYYCLQTHPQLPNSHVLGMEYQW